MSSRAVIALVIFIVITLLEPVATIESYKELPIQEAEVIIGYGSNGDLNLVQGLGCNVIRVFKVFDIALARCPANILGNLRALGFDVVPNSNVSIGASINEFKVISPQVVAGSSTLASSMNWSWATSRVSADIAWRYMGAKGNGSVIAILDTGIDPTHPFLSGKLVGWAEFDSKGRPVCSKPHDTHGHGTWVASIAAGGNDEDFVFGIAPEAKLVVALVLPYGSGTIAQILAGLEWVLSPYDICSNKTLNVNVSVVSMSFGVTGNYSSILVKAVGKLIESGIVPIAAIGNGGPYTSSCPGNIWRVIGVGTTDLNNTVAPFSSYEDVEWPDPPESWPFKGGYPRSYRKPDVVAPGVDVPGAFPGGLIAIGSGTSASTPIVAGIAAIVRESLVDQGLSGLDLVEAVYDIITSTAFPIDHPGAGNGLVDAYLATARARSFTVKEISIDLHPSVARPLDTVALKIGGIDTETKVHVYVSGQNVFEGPQPSDNITIKVPLTHFNGNTVAVVDETGHYYGRTLLNIVPRLIVEGVCSLGRQCRSLVTGIGIGDTIMAHLENNIITLTFADLRGTCDISFLPPLTMAGQHTLVVVDLSNPQISLVAEIAISSTIIEPTRALIHVIAKPYYIANSIDFVDVYAEGGTVKEADIAITYPAGVDVRIINVTALGANLYRIWFRIDLVSESGAYAAVKISVELEDGVTEHVTIIRILPRDPYAALIEQVSELSEDVCINTTALWSEIIAINSTAVSLGRSIVELDNEVNNINRLLQGYAESSKWLSLALIVCALTSLAALVLSIYVMLKQQSMAQL